MTNQEKKDAPDVRIMVEVNGEAVFMLGTKGVMPVEDIKDAVAAKYWCEKSASHLDAWLKSKVGL